MSQKSELETLYAAAAYVVFAEDKKVTFQVAKANKDLAKLLANQSVKQWAFITAHNPGSRRLSTLLNQQRQGKLIAEVTVAGWLFFNGVARAASGTVWPQEDSLLVCDISEREALDLAARYQQNAIVVGQQNGDCRLSWVV